MAETPETDVARILREANQPLVELRALQKTYAELKASISLAARAEENPHVTRRFLALIGEEP